MRLVLAAFLLAPAAAPQGPIVVVPPERARAPAAPREPVVPISSALAEAFEPNADLLVLPAPTALERSVLEAEDDCSSCGPRTDVFGFTRELPGRAASAPALRWRSHELPGGERLWTAAVRSPGAHGLRLRLEGVELRGERLLVWAWNGDAPLARGPFTDLGPPGSGSFWSPSLPGDTAYLEVSGPDRPRLRVAALAHFDRPPGGASTDESGASEPSGNSDPCHVEVDCATLPSGLGFALDATGQMNFQKADGAWSRCTGTLVNDLDPTSQTLFFLTAYHCIDTSAKAASLEVVWHYQEDCGGAKPDWFALERNCGATILEQNPTTGGNDLCFLVLDGEVQPGVAFAGITNAETPDGDMYCLHHPSGDTKKYTRLTLASLFLCPFAWDPTDYDFLEALEGSTEGGSSGAGLFDANSILYGQNLGKCCEAWLGLECEDSTCSNHADWRVVFGETEESWPFIEKWLETGGTLHVDGANTSPPFEGTPSDPFQTVAQALAAAFPGVRISIAAGSYPETVTVAVETEVTSAGGTAVVGE